jgi:outer membrane protein assembly factor BamD (BamD/ComL family)
MDIANFLASRHEYPQAAAAYEQLLRFYPTYEQIEQVDLMLGMIYGRYLNQPDRAKENLRRAISRMHFSRDLELAKSELAHLESPGAQG